MSETVKRRGDDENALSADERREREIELHAKILELERAEEFHIEQIEKNGGELLRRADADYRAVLGLADTLPAPTME